MSVSEVLSARSDDANTPTSTIQWRSQDRRMFNAVTILNDVVNWIECFTRQHSIGYMGDGFYRSKDPTNSIKVLKEQIVHRQIKHTISRHEHKTQQVPQSTIICMGWLEDGSHRGQVCQAWTAVGLPPRYPRDRRSEHNVRQRNVLREFLFTTDHFSHFTKKCVNEWDCVRVYIANRWPRAFFAVCYNLVL